MAADKDGISRREVIRGAAAGGVALALVPTAAGAQTAPAQAPAAPVPATVTGRVFDDADGASRPGLPGVLVSNGRDVAVTDADGRYVLPVTDETVVFVVSRDGVPNGFHVLSVDGNAYETRYVPAKEPDGRQIRVSVLSQFHDEMRRDTRPGALLQPRLPARELHAATVIANVFDGGPRTAVTLKVGDADPVAMGKRVAPDPFVAEVYARNEASKKPWVSAAPCSHLYAARLPALKPGTYPLVVEAVNEYGRRVSTKLALEVEG